MQSLSKFQDGLQKNRIYNTKICIEPQITLHIQITLKKDQRWEHYAPWFQTISQSYSYQISMILSIFNTVIPEYSLEGLLLKLKLQYYGHLMQRADSLEKTLVLGKIESKRRRRATEDEMVGWHHRHQRTWVWANSGRWWRTGKPGVLQFMGSQSQTRLSNWTTRHSTYPKKQFHLSFIWVGNTKFSHRLTCGSSERREQIYGHIQ